MMKNANTVVDGSSLELRAHIRRLDARVDTLIKHATQMRRQSEKIAAERARLRMTHEQARHRIEVMLAQLKSLEQQT